MDSNQPSLLPVQIIQNWQGTDSLACDKLEPARRAGIQLVFKINELHQDSYGHKASITL